MTNKKKFKNIFRIKMREKTMDNPDVTSSQDSDLDIISKYKCRYCGEIFDTRGNDKRHRLWEGRIFQSLFTYEEQCKPLRYAIHFAEEYAENPHIGFADLMGFEVVRKNEEGN